MQQKKCWLQCKTWQSHKELNRGLLMQSVQQPQQQTECNSRGKRNWGVQAERQRQEKPESRNSESIKLSKLAEHSPHSEHAQVQYWSLILSANPLSGAWRWRVHQNCNPKGVSNYTLSCLISPRVGVREFHPKLSCSLCSRLSRQNNSRGKLSPEISPLSAFNLEHSNHSHTYL